MTAEIGILNRQGVALAADSAVTISGNGKEKILNSANKLFNLIKGKPVGFMVYGNGSFMGVPWEVIVDYYRGNFDDTKEHSKLESICDDFISKLSQNSSFYNEDASLQLIHNKMSTHLENLIIQTQDELSKRFPNIQVDEEMSLSVFKETINQSYEELYSLDYGINFTKEDENYIYSMCDSIIDALCKQYIKFDLPIDLFNKLKNICSFLMCRDVLFNYSGIVIAGYGDDEILPRLFHYRIEGIINNKLKYNIEKTSVINQSEFNGGNIAEIVPFAQQEMVHSILTGMDPYLQDFILQNISQGYENILKTLSSDNMEINNKLTQYLSNEFNTIQSNIINYQRDNFVNPIINMVAMLNKDELATMAENLVNITSFKRKFTTDTETVGGPIDVAIISKSDGFIWIKRKHYFKPELNHSFFNINK